MSDYTTQDAVKSAMNGDASIFKNAVSDILMDKVRDAVSLKKMQVTSSFMSADTEEEIQGDTDVDSEVQ